MAMGAGGANMAGEDERLEGEGGCCVVGKDTQWQMELVGRLDALAGAVVATGGKKVRDVNEV